MSASATLAGAVPRSGLYELFSGIAATRGTDSRVHWASSTASQPGRGGNADRSLLLSQGGLPRRVSQSQPDLLGLSGSMCGDLWISSRSCQPRDSNVPRRGRGLTCVVFGRVEGRSARKVGQRRPDRPPGPAPRVWRRSRTHLAAVASRIDRAFTCPIECTARATVARWATPRTCSG